jgi:hypothetical protein
MLARRMALDAVDIRSPFPLTAAYELMMALRERKWSYAIHVVAPDF